jgi:protocatechuate 3,4-dioxygenase beta subunit
MKGQTTMRLSVLALFVLISLPGWSLPAFAAEQPFRCEPTPEDEMGPFYRPDAPKRTSIGTSYLLFGTVKSARDCSPIGNAKIEFWMTGPQGRYGDDWRATVFSSAEGTFHFMSHAPTDYGNRQPHIHIRVTAAGFSPVVTQHYPAKGAGEALFDLVLIPSPID